MKSRTRISLQSQWMWVLTFGLVTRRASADPGEIFSLCF